LTSCRDSDRSEQLLSGESLATGLETPGPESLADLDRGHISNAASFYGSGGIATHNIVFVVDASGSMIPYMDRVRTDMVRHLGNLHREQTFHIVAFSDDLAGELPGRRLWPADKDSKLAAVRFLSELRAGSISLTDPTSAMRRAFEVLRKADPHKPGHLIWLMTDGGFSGTDRKTLLKDLKQMHRDLEVKMRVRCYGSGEQDPESFASVFKEMGGQITEVQVDSDREDR
jgi:hypothetical protein